MPERLDLVGATVVAVLAFGGAATGLVVGAATSSIGLDVVGLVVLDRTLRPGRRLGSADVHSSDAR